MSMSFQLFWLSEVCFLLDSSGSVCGEDIDSFVAIVGEGQFSCI